MAAKGLLIVVATVLEARDFLTARGALTTLREWDEHGWPMVAVSEHCWLTVSGIGRANAAGATAWALAQSGLTGKPVVNVGIAGALPGGGLTLGDVVLASTAVFLEEGIFLPEGWSDLKNGLGFPLGAAAWADGNRIQCSESLRTELAQRLSNNVVTQGVIATVASCSGTDKAAEAVVRRTQAIAEGMEGAAVVATANRLGCRAAELRVISNTCGERAQQKWEMKNALAKLRTILEMLAN